MACGEATILHYPNGVKVTLVVEDYVPYLRTGLASRTVRAVTKLRGTANPSAKAKVKEELIPNEEIFPGDPDWVDTAVSYSDPGHEEPSAGVRPGPGESIL